MALLKNIFCIRYKCSFHPINICFFERGWFVVFRRIYLTFFCDVLACVCFWFRWPMSFVKSVISNRHRTKLIIYQRWPHIYWTPHCYWTTTNCTGAHCKSNHVALGWALPIHKQFNFDFAHGERKLNDVAWRNTTHKKMHASNIHTLACNSSTAINYTTHAHTITIFK